MAIAVVKQTQNTATGSPVSYTFSGAPTAGNLLVVIYAAIGATTLSPTTPSGWTAHAVGNRVACFSKVSDGTETTASFTYAGVQAVRILALELSGANVGASRFDTIDYIENASTATSQLFTSDAALAGNDEIGIMMVGHNGTIGSEAVDSGWTLATGGSNREIAAYKVMSGGGGAVNTVTASWSTARSYQGAIVFFKPGAPQVTGAAALTGAGALSAAGSNRKVGVAALSGAGALVGAGVGLPPQSGLVGWWDFSEVGSLYTDGTHSVLAAADAAVGSVGDRRGGALYPLPNASGESAFAWPFWYANWAGGSDPGVAVAQVTDGTAPFGTKVATVSQNNPVAAQQASVMMGRNDTAPYIALLAGRTYRVSAYVKVSRADQQVEIFGGGYTSAGADNTDYPSGGMVTRQPADGWVRIDMLYTVKAGTTRSVIGVRGVTTTTTGEMFRVDAWQIEEAADTVRPFFTGTLNDQQQATAASRPTRKDAIVNGRTIGRLDAVDDWMQAIDTSALSVNNWTMFVVFRPLSSSNTGYVMAMDSGNSRYAFITAYTAGKSEYFDQSGSRVVIGDTDLTNFHIAAVTRPVPSGNIVAYQDGTPAAAFAAAATVAATRGVKLGMSDGTLANDVWGGDIGEAIAYDRVLTNAEMNRVGQYLAAKWGMTWTTIAGGVTGAATITGAGALTATGKSTVRATAALTGSGTLAAAGTDQKKGVAALTGAGALSTGSKRTAIVSTPLTGAGALSVTSYKRTVKGVVALSGSGALSAGYKRTVKHTAALTGLGGIVADGNVTGGPIIGVAVLSGQSGGTVGATKSTIRAVGALTGLGGSVVAGKRIAYRSAALTGAGALASGGKRIAYGAPVLTGAGALTSSGKRTMKSSTVPLTGAGSLGATGKATKRSGTVVLTGSGAVTGSLLDYSAPTDYRLDVYDLAGALVRSDTLGVDYSPDLVYAYALNGPGAIGFQLPTRKAGVTQANFAVGKRTLKLYRNDILVWAGYLTGADGDRDWVNFRGLGWYEGLRHRLIDQNQHFYSIEALNIAWALIAYTQGKTDLGITRDPGEVASGKLRNRDYCCDDFTLVSEAIEDLAGMHDGFDFWVTPDKVWKTASPRRGVDKTASVIFDALFNLTEVSYGIGSEDMATEVFYVGPNTDECRDLDSMVDATGLATYGRHELGLDTTNIKSDAERDEIAAEVLRYQAVPLSQATVTVPAELGIDPGDFDLGDRVRFRSDDGWLTFDQTMRVIDFAVHVGEGCVEEQVVQLDSVFA